jgi:hypothetical protein
MKDHLGNRTGVPFAWQDKRMLRRIREQCEDPSSALGVYLALTVVASDMGKDEFQTTHKWLASLSGFSERSVRSRLRDLQALGAVAIVTPALKALCTYRLLPFGNGCHTPGNDCRTFGNGETTSIAAIRRNKEEKEAARPFGTADRISLEKQLGILRGRLGDLEADTAEQWQRDAHPELVSRKQELRDEIKALEDRLLNL